MDKTRSRLRRGHAAVLISAALVIACANGDAEPAPAVEPPATATGPTFTRCTEPRGPMCTREYRPACGHRCAEPPCEDRRTYGNACTACADADVSATTPGACEDGPPAPSHEPLR